MTNSGKKIGKEMDDKVFSRYYQSYLFYENTKELSVMWILTLSMIVMRNRPLVSWKANLQ